MLNIKDVKYRDIVMLDDSFDCIDAGPVAIIKLDSGELGFRCTQGVHSLRYQCVDNDDLFGMSKPKSTEKD